VAVAVQLLEQERHLMQQQIREAAQVLDKLLVAQVVQELSLFLIKM
jgi:hypothetical protein